MKKYSRVLGAVCALFVVLGLAGCNNYADQIEALKKQNEELAAKLEKLDAELEAEEAAAVKRGYAKFLRENSKVLLDQKYKSTYGESFEVTSEGEVVYTDWSGADSMRGTLVRAAVPTGYTGIILYVACETHVNYGAYCYPNYDEDKWDGSKVDANNYGAITHSGCYTAFYVTDGNDSTGSTLTMAQAVWHPENEPNGYTACANSIENVHKLFNELGFDSTCGALSSTLSRSAVKVPGFINGTFILAD